MGGMPISRHVVGGWALNMKIIAYNRNREIHGREKILSLRRSTLQKSCPADKETIRQFRLSIEHLCMVEFPPTIGYMK